MHRARQTMRPSLVVAAAWLMPALAFSQSPPPPPSAFAKAPEAFSRLTEEKARETEVYTLGVQAVVWSTQWVKAGESLRLFSRALPEGASPSPYDPMPHGINVWGHARKLLNADTRLIETPNTETLYSIMVADLGSGPVVIEHPDFGDRYFRTSIWDVHSDTHTISQKQDGGHPPPYVIVPVGWKGTIPPGLKTIVMRSRYFQFAPHIAVYGESDLPNVARLHDGLKVVPLADWLKPGAKLPPAAPMRPIRRADTKTPPELLFFEELGETLKDITVRDDEVGFARQLEAIGVTLKDGFQFEKLDAPAIAGLKRAVQDGQSLAAHRARALAPLQPGGTWSGGGDVTNLDDWLQRAGVGFGYVWGDLASEILYPMTRIDADGKPLGGENRYVLHFPHGQLPPARYWRISMYDEEGFFFNNPINRYGIGNMAEKPEPDPDGGLTILIQRDSPGNGKEANWLPAPANGFFLAMRLYQPEERMYQGKYIVPPLTQSK